MVASTGHLFPREADAMSCDPQTNLPVKACARRRSRPWWAAALLLALVVVVDGSRCTPADPNQPIQIIGSASPVESDGSVLRIGTFNIHSGKGRDRKTDLARTASVFKMPLDVVGLNEVRGTWSQSIGLNQAEQLSSLWGMQSAFIPTERRWWHDHFGNALLTRLPIRQIQRLPLPGLRGKAFRCAALSQVEFQKRMVQVLTVHVDSQSDRGPQLQAVIAMFLALQPPAILMGDLNSTSDDPQMRELLARPDVVDAQQETPLDARGRKRIDWVLARGLRCRSGQVVENEASDHPALVAEFEIEHPTPTP
ncbi:MAG: Endonuclease/exonuclease/phosphatase [Schlesneria sp.]|nr:Endonuclease/exonuclease/phosphatase [Schlesneria sp.]